MFICLHEYGRHLINSATHTNQYIPGYSDVLIMYRLCDNRLKHSILRADEVEFYIDRRWTGNMTSGIPYDFADNTKILNRRYVYL